MTTKKKTIINARRNAKAAAGKVRNVQRKLSYAQMESQIASLEEQIALLKEEGNRDEEGIFLKGIGKRDEEKPLSPEEGNRGKGIGKRDEEKPLSPEEGNRGKGIGNRDEEKPLSPIPYPLSPEVGNRGKGIGNRDEEKPLSPSAGVAFPVPVLTHVFAAGPHAISVHWEQVPGVGSYTVRITSDPEGGVTVRSMTLPSYTIATTVTGLEPGTTYWVSVRSAAQSGTDDVSSAYAVPQAVTTPEAPQSGVAGDLQAWLDALREINERFFTSLPQFEHVLLTPAERRRTLGSGVRRYGYIDKVSDVAEEFPQFWPAYFEEPERLKERIREIEVLRNLLIDLESGSRSVLDMLLTAGTEAYRLANMYYGSVRNAARQQIPDAEAVYRMLRLFWNRRRRPAEEPTEQQLLRDASALMHGKKDGKIFIKNESDQVIRGKRVVIDNTMRKAAGRKAPSRGGARVVDRSSPGFSDRSTAGFSDRSTGGAERGEGSRTTAPRNREGSRTTAPRNRETE